MMNHEDSSTDLSGYSSSSSSPGYFKHEHEHHHPYTVQSPSSISNDGDKSSFSSNQRGPAYTVQSPSLLSTDGDKSSVSYDQTGPPYTMLSPSLQSIDGDKSSFSSNRTGFPYTMLSPSSQSLNGDKSSISSNRMGPAYIVQSPSSTTSPSRLSSTFSSSSGSRFSGFRRSWNRNRHDREWNQCYVIMEEEEEEEEDTEPSELWQWLFWVSLGIVLMCLIIWGMASPYRPHVAVKSLAMNNFYFGEGLDYTGVPTKFLTINCTFQMTIRNSASFFGIHISSAHIDLSYLDITVATGQMSRYYQPRKSERILSLNLNGNRVPLYGAGSSLELAFRKGGVPLRLGFDIRSHINVIFKIVKKKHMKHISCSANISRSNNGVVRFKKDSCKYN